jgi:hypothetical protein
MLDVEIGRNLKVARLTTPERWCMVAGVLAIAAKAPVRGALLIGDQRVEAADVARQADVPRATAAATLRKLRELGMLHEDEEIGAEVVHDFNDWNPAPKVDRTAAERMRRMRAREARNETPVTPPVTPNARNGYASVTPPEVEGEVEHPPKPPQGGEVVTFERRPVAPDRLALARRLLDEFNGAAGTDYGAFTAQGKPSESLKRIIGALTRSGDVTFEDGAAAIRWRLANPFWEGKAHPGVVFGPGVFDQAQQSAAATVSADETRRRKLVGR